MPSGCLVKLVQDFLDAELAQEQRRGRAGEARSPDPRLAEARRKLQAHLDTVPHDPSAPPLARLAEAYLAAVAAFDRARDADADLDAPARQLDRAQRDVRDAPYQLSRDDPDDHGVRLGRVLVAIDEDDAPSQWALAEAVRLAESMPGQLRLVHVIQPGQPDRYDDVYRAADVDQQYRRRAAEMLRRHQDTLPADAECDALVRDGDVAGEIVGAARRWGADLIVMGTHGHGRLARFLLGSTAESVIRLAPCPVLTVAHPPTRPTRPTEGSPLGPRQPPVAAPA